MSSDLAPYNNFEPLDFLNSKLWVRQPGTRFAMSGKNMEISKCANLLTMGQQFFNRSYEMIRLIKFWAFVLTANTSFVFNAMAYDSQLVNSLGPNDQSPIAICKILIDSNEGAEFQVKAANLSLIKLNGEMFIKNLSDEHTVVFRGSLRETDFLTKYMVGNWFEFKSDSTGALVPTKDSSVSFARDDKTIYTNYIDNANTITATAKFASGITYFVGRHWDQLKIKYDKDTKRLDVKIVGGLWGIPSHTYSDFTMQCE